MTITKRKKVEYAIPTIQSNIIELSIYHGRINVNVVGDGGRSSGGAADLWGRSQVFSFWQSLDKRS